MSNYLKSNASRRLHEELSDVDAILEVLPLPQRIAGKLSASNAP